MIVLLGASGYVGQYFVRYFCENGISVCPISRNGVNYYNRDDLRILLRSVNATYLINCAGYVGKPNLDACETHKRECLSANAYLPTVIAEVCHGLNIPWGNVASGCVYQGDNGGVGFAETDPPNFSFRQNNCSFYSGTKALAEELLQGIDCYQWRMRMPFGERSHPRNYITKLLDYERLLVATNSLTHLGQFVENCWKCLKEGMPFGIYNMVNNGSLSIFRVTELINEHLKRKSFEFFESNIEFESTVVAPRSNCVLNNGKAIKAGMVWEHVEDAMIRSLSAFDKR